MTRRALYHIGRFSATTQAWILARGNGAQTQEGIIVDPDQ